MRYEDFLSAMHRKVEAGDEGLEGKMRKRFEYIRLNYHRSRRVQRTYAVPEELRALIEEIKEPQCWMVLTEDWCGDSAQTIPYIAKIIAHNPNIELRLLSRDANPELMEKYLTNGTRSIPMLVAFDQHGEELFRWGPRPAEAAALFKKGQDGGLPKYEVNQHLHRWYGRNRGRAVEAEFTTILTQLVLRAV